MGTGARKTTSCMEAAAALENMDTCRSTVRFRHFYEEMFMCLAVPVRVVEALEDGRIKVRIGEGESFMEVSSLLLPEPPRPGEYVIVHAGFALRTLDPDEARESLAIFHEIAALGQDGSTAML